MKNSQNFHLEALPLPTHKLFENLAVRLDLEDFYLAGGSGLALHFGHRQSIDLDFFHPRQFEEAVFLQRLSRAGQFRLEQRSPQSIIGMLDGVKISFLGYLYPLLAPLQQVAGISLASIIDIACMKLDAISSRGTKRDFVDLYFVLTKVMTLPELLSFFTKKYTSVNYNLEHIKKSLIYFADAEEEPAPKMLTPTDWLEVKSFFEREIRALG